MGLVVGSGVGLLEGGVGASDGCEEGSCVGDSVVGLDTNSTCVGDSVVGEETNAADGAMGAAEGLCVGERVDGEVVGVDDSQMICSV